MGLSVVEDLVRKGWNVTIADMNEEAGQKIAERLGQQVVFIKIDVTDYDQQAKAFVETWSKWHRLDFVFANAVMPSFNLVRVQDEPLLTIREHRALATELTSTLRPKREMTAHQPSQTPWSSIYAFWAWCTPPTSLCTTSGRMKAKPANSSPPPACAACIRVKASRCTLPPSTEYGFVCPLAGCD